MGGGRFRGDLKKSFTQRVVTVWNALPGRVVEAGCITSFKKYLHEYLARHNIHNMGQVLASGIRWAGQGLSCIGVDSMGQRASSAL